jgi:hypothetical protein
MEEQIEYKCIQPLPGVPLCGMKDWKSAIHRYINSHWDFDFTHRCSACTARYEIARKEY